MDIVCPACRKTIASSMLPEGKAVCPHCKRPLDASPAGAPAPKAKAPASDLFADLMSEARRNAPARGAAPAAPAAAPNGAQASIPPPPRPRVARARPSSAEEAGHHRSAHIAVILGILAVIGVGYFAVAHIRKGLREDAVSDVLRQVEFDKTGVERTLSEADKARDAQDYASAATGYERTVARSNTLLSKLREGTAALTGGSLADAVRKCDADLAGFVKRAKEALEIPEIKYGSKGMVQLDDGTWVTPEEKQKRFEDRMKAEGRTLQQTGEWLTADEVRIRKGYVQYIGPSGTPQWVTQEEYAKLTAAAAAAAAVSSARPPPPTVAVVPPPRLRLPPTATFDPAAPIWIIDDFESGNATWSSVSWGKDQANPCTVAVQKQGDSSKLAVTLAGGPKDKAAIVRSLPADFSSRSKLVFDLYNATGEPIKVAIAVETSANPSFHEGRWQMLRVDNNEVVKFDLRMGDFKSSATNWAYATQIKGLESIRQLYILFYTDKPGKVYLDNISVLGQ